MKQKLIASLFVVSHLLAYAPEDIQRLKDEVAFHLPAMEGWCSVEKACYFIDLVLEAKPAVYVEIGVFGGRSLYPVAATFQFLGAGVAIAIDPWDRFECIRHYDPVQDAAHLKWWGTLNMDFIYSSYLLMLRRFGLERHVETLRATSEEAASEITEIIDVLHIDGNHSQYVSNLDVMLYLPKVRSRGYVWLTDALWQERKEAVALLSEQCDLVKHVDFGNCLLFQKR